MLQLADASGGIQWFKLPEPVRIAVVRGELTAGDVLVAVAVAMAQPWAHAPNRATVQQLARRTRLSERTVRYALRGRASRPSLSPYVEQTRSGWRWKDASRFVRVTWGDWRALRRRRRPHADELRIWCWSLGHLAGGRPHARVRATMTDIGHVLGWAPGRVRRALLGAKDRLGAAAAGLVDLVDGWIVSRCPLAGAVDGHRARERTAARSTGGQPCGPAVDSRSHVAASACARYWQWIRDPKSGSEVKTLLVDLLSQWATGGPEGLAASRSEEWGGARPSPVPPEGGAGKRWPTVSEAAAYLNRWRTRDRRRGWALSIVRGVLEAAKARVAVRLMKGERPGWGAPDPPYDPQGGPVALGAARGRSARSEDR